MLRNVVSGALRHPLALWAEGNAARAAAQAGMGPSTRGYSAEAEEDEDFEPAESVVKLADDICSLNMLDAADLTKLLRKRFGLSGMAMGGGMPMGMPMAAAPAAAAAAPAEEEAAPEQTEFAVKLAGLESPDKKIKVIKEVRALLPDLGLKEAKALVESAPADLKTGVTKEEAEDLKKKLEEVGAKISIE